MTAVLHELATALDSVGMAMCVLDQNDHTLIWNRAFLRAFPERAERINEGEHFRDKLRRFSQVRLTGDELGSIDRYIKRVLLATGPSSGPSTSNTGAACSS